MTRSRKRVTVEIVTHGRTRTVELEASPLAFEPALVDMARKKLNVAPDAFRHGRLL